MNRRYVAFGAFAAAILIAALAISPDQGASALGWLAADPLRFGLALLAVSLVRPFLAWPTTLIAVAVGFGYGWVGVPFGVFLLTLTALPPYYLARLGRVPPAPDGGLGGRISAAGERFVGVAGGTRTVAATRLLPMPSDVISLGAGIAHVRLRPFLLGTAIGEFPWVIAGVAIGVSADRIVSGDLSTLDPALFIGMAGVALLLLAGPLYRVYQRRRTDPTAG